MKNIIKSLFVIVAVAAVAGGATWSYFNDEVVSAGNTFSAGTLDIVLDGTDNPTATFNVSNMRPGNQPKGTFRVKNVGSINGHVDIENITLIEYENGCVSAEILAGDNTCEKPGIGEGELGSVVNLQMFVDNGCDGWISTGDNVFYNGKVSNLPGSFELNESLAPDQEKCIVALFNWWSTPDDNKAQGDSMSLDFTFELAQTTGQ